MELVDSLKTNLGRELAVIDLYQNYVRQIKDPDARKCLLKLIEESMIHADTFRKLLLAKTLGIETKDTGLSDEALAHLLDFGMKEERGIRLLYEEHLGWVKDEEYAAALKKIIEDEKRHEQMLAALYNRLRGE